MDAYDEMVEEHLDEEYQKSELDGRLQNVQSQLNEWENVSSQYNGEFRDKLQSAVALLKLHTQSYQRIAITRRRRAQQRRRKRQMELRNLFTQMMEDVQIQFLEMLPFCLEPSAFMSLTKEQTDEKLKVWETKENKNVATMNKFRFFEDVVSGFTEEQWLDTFHMTKTVFNLICSPLQGMLTSASMSLESLIAMCIYAMATGSHFRSVGTLFNKPQTYVRSALYKFVQVLIRTFESEFLSMPQTRDTIANVCNGFSRASHMPPCCVGVLSVFELPTFSYTRPGFKAYGMDRVIVQTLIDDHLLFRKVEVDLQKPTMFLRSPNVITHMPDQNIAGLTLTNFVAAPPQYPLRSWLMQKFMQPKEQCEHDFNAALGHLNIFRELALQRLFGRWQILSASEFIEPESKSLIAKACCILHNILEESGEVYCEDWSENTDLNKYEYKFEPSLTKYYSDSRNAQEKRQIIARMIQTSKEEG